MLTRRSICKILILVILVTSYYISKPVIAKSDLSESNWSGSQECQFIAPDEWRGRTLSWDGSCQAGRAHGQGVLRAYKKGETTLLFLGDMRNGELSWGVIKDEGYIAGRFNQGKLLPNSDRNVIIKAFDKASAAATAYGQRLQKAGNVSSSKFYMKLAHGLEQQMD